MGKFVLSNDAKRLLRRVRNAILKNPETYNQKHWCGSAYCIAGHIVALGIKDGDIDRVDTNKNRVYKGEKMLGNTFTYAKKKLGLTKRLADNLFLTPECSTISKKSGWNVLAAEYFSSLTDMIYNKNYKLHAKVGAKRIDYFIERNIYNVSNFKFR